MGENILISNRSVLYNLKPIGIGTEMVESLTSYLSRLAFEHSTTVGQLVNKLIIPAKSKVHLIRSSEFGGNRFYEGAKTINGYMDYASNIIYALGKLTSRTDLQELTLVNLKGVIPLRGLFKQSLTWCPVCIKEWRDDKSTVYYPLIWYLKLISVCHKHSCYLTDTCPHCNKQQDILRRQSLIGICQHCFQRFDLVPFTEEFSGDKEWQKYVVRNVSSLLSYEGRLISDRSSFLVNNLNRICEEVFDGRITNFSKQLNFAESSIRGWLSGEVTPSLEKQIFISHRLSIKIEQLLFDPLNTDEIDVIVQEKKEEVLKSTNDKRKIDHDFVKKQLEKIIQSRESISMSEAAEKIGVNKRTLYRNFRDLCIQISQKHKEYLGERKLQRIMDLKALIENSFIGLCEQRIYPSRRKMEHVMDKPGVLKERELQHHWKGLLIKSDLLEGELIEEGEGNGNELNRV
ncbi:hypothetical protein GH741_05285 [Aquibacillus halophilus]|uniref:TniQ domain-containing protein n=1 Tax=Aquibacillus halophilus TaxID=930132 RepID=A0A6A8DGR7_9BACI|nr:TniQ family protein [Aquibacillus halophilus]MRH42087.1 hypothetical protein [Aquibacillus halophilus]